MSATVHPMPSTTAPDSVLTILGTVITSLLAAVAWLYRKASGSQRAAPVYENGKKISRQDYIAQLETYIESNRAIMESAGPRLATLEQTVKVCEELAARHNEQIEKLEDEMTMYATDLRQIRQTSQRVAVNQQSQEKALRVIQVTLERIEGRLPA